MSTYARIENGVVAELFTPPTGVPISACFNAALTWVECDGTAGVAVGWTAVETAGTWAFTAPAAPPAPTLAQQAQALLSGGMQIVSTGTPALNGTYPCDPGTYQRVGGIVAAIGAGLGLPGGGATFSWPDASGMPHSFSTVNFSAFAKAMMDFEYTLNAIIGTNSGTLPAQPVTIA